MKHLTLIDKAFLLKRTSLFAMLDLDLLLIISDKLGTVLLESSESIFSAKDPPINLYFILKGVIVITDEEKQWIAELTTPDFFGDEALFSDTLRGYSATSKTESILLTLSKTNLLTIISECPQVSIGLLQAYTSHQTFRKRMKTSP